MTTDTTDVEAIARIIDPEGMQAYSEAKATGRLADNGQLWADCLYGDRRKTATSRAAAILSYLASRREAQEPVAWLRDLDGTGSLHPASQGDPEAFAVYRTAPPAPAGEVGTTYTIEHDGFTGTVIGSYTTHEGKEGVVLQQVGTKVVHVYGRKWLKTAETAPAGEVEQ